MSDQQPRVFCWNPDENVIYAVKNDSGGWIWNGEIARFCGGDGELAAFLMEHTINTLRQMGWRWIEPT